MTETIRLGYNYDKHEQGSIDVCPHIKLEAYYDKSACEYVDDLVLHCKICEKSFPFEMLIN